MKPHLHCEAIKAWADGEKIQCRPRCAGDWQDCIHVPEWRHDHEYRVKPPEPKYPGTQMRLYDFDQALRRAGARTGMDIRVSTEIANTALRHACDHGQVVPREEFDRAVGDRKTRDAAIADAVMQEAASIVESMAAGLNVTLADMLAVAAEKVRSTAVASIIERAAP
jgi:hypothetical protein